MQDKIKRLLAHPELSEANRKTLMDMQASYKANGGFSDRLKGIGDQAVAGGIDAVTNKIQEALGLGVPKKDVYQALRNNAMKTRDAAVRGALMSAGSKGLDIANQNQAGLITQAGQQNQAFTPQGGSLGAGAAGFEGAADAEAAYGKSIQGINKQEQEAKLKKAEEADEKGKVSKESIRIANEAKFLVQPASKAGDYINGHVPLPPEDKAVVDQEEQSALGKLGDTFKQGAQTLAGGFSHTRQIRQEALERLAARRYPDSYRAFTRLKALANQMVFPILESGALGVNPTDADVELAKKATFDYTAPSQTWMQQLDDIIAKAKGKSFAKHVVTKTTSNKTNGDKAKKTAYDPEGGVADGIFELTDEQYTGKKSTWREKYEEYKDKYLK